MADYGSTYDNTYDPGIPIDPNTGGAYAPVAQSPTTTDSSGNVIVTNQDGSTSSYPPGSYPDANGNVLNSLGQIIGNIANAALPNAAGLAAGALSPYLQNLYSQGNLAKTSNMLLNSGQNIMNVQNPNLLNLIPQLQLQTMQGQATAAGAGAASASMQGQVDPATYSAALAAMQGSMSPSGYSAVNAVMQGTMTPAEAQAVLQKDSLMNGVQTDAQTISQQRAALAKLADIGQSGGMTDADRSQLLATIQQTNAAAASQRQAQIQQLQMQGNAGTGAELAARLSGGQQMANANAMAGANVATSAQARALQAIEAGMQGAGQLNTQLFGQQAQKAQAQDIVNQFNTQAQNTFSLQNAQMAQQAGLANFNTANQIAMQNAAAQNTAGQTNAQLSQQSNLANFQTANQIALANQAAQNQASAVNTANTQQAGIANFSMANQIAMQNAANQQQSNIANAQLGTQANLANFGMANQIAGTNVGIQNQNLLMPYQATQQNYTNALNQATQAGNVNAAAGKSMVDLVNTQLGRSNAAASGATTAATVAPSSGGGSSGGGTNWGSIIGGIGSAIGSIFSDEDLKTDKKEMSDDEVDKMMANMTAYKYRYKGAKSNPETAGVMAQDMPKGSVVDTPAGKMIQKPEAMSQALAILANQHERIRRLEGAK